MTDIKDSKLDDIIRVKRSKYDNDKDQDQIIAEISLCSQTIISNDAVRFAKSQHIDKNIIRVATEKVIQNLKQAITKIMMNDIIWKSHYINTHGIKVVLSKDVPKDVMIISPEIRDFIMKHVVFEFKE